MDVNRTFTALYDMTARIGCAMRARYDMTTRAALSFVGKYDLTDVDRVGASTTALYNMVDSKTIIDELAVSAAIGSKSVGLISLDINSAEGSYCNSFSAVCLNYTEWRKCAVDDSITVVINEIEYTFIIDSTGRNRVFGETVFSISGRSKTRNLDFPHAAAVTATYDATTAKEICGGLCSEYDITLNWQIVNWSISAGIFSADSISPLEIIKTITAAAGAILQSTPAGDTLVVRYLYPMSPGSVSVSDSAEIITVQENFERRACYNAVRVSDKPIVDEDERYIIVELDTERNNGATQFEPGDTVYLRVYSSAAYTMAVTDGTITKIAGDEVSDYDPSVEPFVYDEDVQLSRPINDIVSTDWFGNDLGSLSIVGITGVRAADSTSTSLGIANITYRVKYDVWKLQAPQTALENYYIYVLSAQELDA